VPYYDIDQSYDYYGRARAFGPWQGTGRLADLVLAGTRLLLILAVAVAAVLGFVVVIAVGAMSAIATSRVRGW
jgi:hypothetical protein